METHGHTHEHTHTHSRTRYWNCHGSGKCFAKNPRDLWKLGASVMLLALMLLLPLAVSCRGDSGDGGGDFLLPRLHQIFFHSYYARIHTRATARTRVRVAAGPWLLAVAKEGSNRLCQTSFRRSHTYVRCTDLHTIQMHTHTRCEMGPTGQHDRCVWSINVHVGKFAVRRVKITHELPLVC